MSSDDAPLRPLEGVTILALEHYLAGPLGSTLLADYGADVIKVEAPQGGDAYRLAPPVYTSELGSTSYSFLRVNRNKRSIALDLGSERGRELFLELVDRADVVWENLRPGVMQRFGLDWETLHARNPRLVYATISGFGHTDVLPSPYADRPAFDIIAQALSGIVWRPGTDADPPMYLGFPLADQLSAIMTAFGVSLALSWRAKAGVGTRVDVSMFDVMVQLLEHSISFCSHFNKLPARGLTPTSAPFTVFKGSDGYFVVGVAGNSIWRRFCTAIDREDLVDDPQLESGIARAQVQETVLRPIIEEWAAGMSTAAACDTLNEHGVPAAVVQNVNDLFDDPHVAARNMLLEVDDPVLGRLAIAGNPIKFSAIPEIDVKAPPQLGADTAQILRDVLGLTEQEITNLDSAGIAVGHSTADD